MTGAILVLTLAYVAVAALLLNLNLATRQAGWLKAVAIVLVSGLYIGSWHGYRGLLGWPSHEPMPEIFRVLWISIEDPDKAKALPGSIYYWVRDLDEAGIASGAPRAHSVPWDEATAEEAQRALDLMNQGEMLNGRRSRRLMMPSEVSSSATDAPGGETFSTGEDGAPPEFEFVAVPLPSLPAKRVPESGG